MFSDESARAITAYSEVIHLAANDMRETDPLPKIELSGTGTGRIAGRTVRQETPLSGRDGFTGRNPDQAPINESNAIENANDCLSRGIQL